MIQTPCTAAAVALLAYPAVAALPPGPPQQSPTFIVNQSPRPPQVTNVGGTHYSGQSFLTWSEVSSLVGESYKVYRSLSKIEDVRDAGVFDLGQRVWEDSGEYYAGRVFDDRPCEHEAPDCGRPQKPLPCFRPRYVQRYWVPDDVGSAQGGPACDLAHRAAAGVAGADRGRRRARPV